MERGLRAKTKVIDESFQMSDEDCKVMMDYLKATGESGEAISEAYKSIHKKIEEKEPLLEIEYADKFEIHLISEDESEKELEKLTRELKAKDWI